MVKNINITELFRKFRKRSIAAYDEDDEDDEDNDDEDDMMSMVRDLAKNKKKYRASAASSSEATFTDKHLLPAIQRVLLREIKRPDTTSKYQPEDDFVKLMKQMKSSLCDQLCFGVANPTSLGLLVEGF
ncbi:hypothetical protein HPULCUR_008577 [Helicostylum pulchrum]|uniref:Uncharacterized protein n=1 Tax=Helicostylum pulchrum TaxID=562976 RepID=A0ABP9Y811_9FUNG